VSGVRFSRALRAAVGVVAVVTLWASLLAGIRTTARRLRGKAPSLRKRESRLLRKRGSPPPKLVLTRKSKQSIMIGDDIEVFVLSIMDEKARIGIQAPSDIPVSRREATGARSARPRRALAGLLGLVALAAFVVAASRTGWAPYLPYFAITLLLGTIAWTTLVWMVNAWRTPASLSEGGLRGGEVEPAHSFSLIVPARHEEAVLERTLSRLVAGDHPAFEVLVVIGTDDHATREVAERVADRHPDCVKVVLDDNWPKSKPKALNTALPYCTGTITGVFDAEDEVHPELLRRVDQCFQNTDADVVQAGVQLMNFRSSWLTVRNVLEYYFWFRSRLHFHARHGFIPLGGNTVFIRTEVLQAVSGWDQECLAEDCELGVRLSALGARTVVAYEPELVTREECPPTLGAFTKQRTRWSQGYLQTLSRGYWRRLPLRQRALGAYTLAMPYLIAIAWLLIPVALATAVAVKMPVPLTMISFLPALPLLATLVVEVAGLADFCRTYGERASARDYGRLVLGLPLYQAVLAFAAARAVVREIRGDRGWEKTAHLGLHLAPAAAEQVERSNGSHALDLERSKVAGATTETAVASAATLQVNAATLNGGPKVAASYGTVLTDHLDVELNGRGGGAGNGHIGGPHRFPDELFGAVGGEPLWARLSGVTTDGAGTLALPATVPVKVAVGSALGQAWTRLRNALARRADLLVMVAVVAAVGIVQAANMAHWPDAHFDEGTYIGDAWAVGHGALAPYTYSYGHPPLAWLLITLWTWARGIFGDAGYSIETGRELMFVVTLASCSLLFVLARRLSMGRVAAAGAVILFALSPLSLFYHRAVLLDNVAIAWALAAFVLALTPRRRLWAFAGSGACFALCVLSKETALILLPALLFAAAQNADMRTRRYCLTLFASFIVLLGLAFPLYAVLKGELLPGPGHVSLIGAIIFQLFSREASGSVFDPNTASHATVTAWLWHDPWLVGAALVLSPIALARRSIRVAALAYLIQVVMVLRPGYLPDMYVIGLLPFAALIVAGSIEAVWRLWSRALRRFLPAVIVAAGFALLLAVPVQMVGARWSRDDRVAMTARPDAAPNAAKRWLVDNVGHDKRLIVDDAFWIYLIDHGFDSHPMSGGFFSRTVVSFWPLDYDPAVKRHFPNGWRDFDYIVSTDGIRAAGAHTPSSLQAIDHSRVLARFGEGAGAIEIRAITGARAAG
jgi:carbon storage regulator CsrA